MGCNTNHRKVKCLFPVLLVRHPHCALIPTAMCLMSLFIKCPNISTYHIFSHSIPSFYPAVCICTYPPVIKHGNWTSTTNGGLWLRQSFMNGGFSSTVRLIAEGYNVVPPNYVCWFLNLMNTSFLIVRYKYHKPYSHSNHVHQIVTINQRNKSYHLNPHFSWLNTLAIPGPKRYPKIVRIYRCLFPQSCKFRNAIS